MRGVTAAGRAGEGRGEAWDGRSAHAPSRGGGACVVAELGSARRMRFWASRWRLAPEGPPMAAVR